MGKSENWKVQSETKKVIKFLLASVRRYFWSFLQWSLKVLDLSFQMNLIRGHQMASETTNSNMPQRTKGEKVKPRKKKWNWQKKVDFSYVRTRKKVKQAKGKRLRTRITYSIKKLLIEMGLLLSIDFSMSLSLTEPQWPRSAKTQPTYKWIFSLNVIHELLNEANSKHASADLFLLHTNSMVKLKAKKTQRPSKFRIASFVLMVGGYGIRMLNQGQG